MEFKYEVITYPYINMEGRPRIMKVEYTLWFSNKSLIDIRNEFHHSVDSKSECWEFFKNKYKNHGKV